MSNDPNARICAVIGCFGRVSMDHLDYCNKCTVCSVPGCLKLADQDGECVHHRHQVQSKPSEHEALVNHLTEKLDKKRQQILLLRELLRLLDEGYQTIESEYLKATRNL